MQADISQYHHQMARFKNLHLVIEDHGCLILGGQLEWANNGTVSGFPGYAIDTAFIYRFFDCLGISKFSEAEGESAWFLYDKPAPVWGGRVTDGLVGIAPLYAKDGKLFLFREWEDFILKKGLNLSAYELRTGINPKGKHVR